MGAELCANILRGCTVHWKKSVNRVSDIVTKSKEEHKIFRYIGHTIQDLTNQTDVKLAFDVLCGVKSIAEAKDLLPPDIAATSDQQTNVHWAQSAHWVRWWSIHLKMFCKAYSLRDNEEWDATPNTNNAVESLNHQSITEGCSNIAVLMKNIYMEDRLHAVKIVASEKNINISYENNNQEDKEKKRKKRKRSRLSLRGANSSLQENEAQMEQTPRDKRAKLDKKSSKRKLHVGKKNDWDTR